MDKAGIQAGDVLEAANGYPLNGAPNWFLARAHFERNRPIELQVRRGEQHLALKLVTAEPVWRTWKGSQYLPAIALQLARSALLLLAIIVGFSRPQQLSARLAALMFAIGAVAEGYPSAGWAAALRHLPAVLAIPIGLATASCVLASVVWLAFFASFPRPWLSRRLRCVLGDRPRSAFWNSHRGLSDRHDLHAIRFGQALAGGAFGALRALDTRCCWRHPAAVSQQVPNVSANRTGQALGSMARGYPPLFHDRLPHPCGQLSLPG